ncbi:MAG: succinylglutamate desuccinylase/aspartoacylase family protein [Candidatus Latescibacteria bacterium]|jgi:hypothetical protein|nr:succinylglutamate desuccinylase/aspartoacylase family protein [Candidatus Latescibacterota bacterium]
MAVLEFGTAKARAGQKAWGQLEVREGGKRVRIPTVVVNGREEGEHVVILANQHGAEYNGIEAIRRFCEEVDPRTMKGSVFAIPTANPRAGMLCNEFFPENEPPDRLRAYRSGRNRPPGFDRNACPYNMNRRWPGQKGSGLLVDRVVYEIWNRAVMASHRRASLLVDFHCHQSPSAIYATFRRDVDLGVVTGIPAVIHTRSAAKPPQRPYSRIACYQAGIQALTIELGGQRAFRSVSVEQGRVGIANLLKFWGLLPGRLRLPERTVILDPWRNSMEDHEYARPSYAPCEAQQEGLVVEYQSAYERVRAGDLICQVLDPFTGKVIQEGRADMNGVMYTPPRPEAPCRKGDRLFAVSIARRVRTADYVRKLDAATCKARIPHDPDCEIEFGR